MVYQLFYEGICLQNKRPSNMDSLLICRREIMRQDVGFFVVCDGVGSSKFGGEVAEFLVTELESWFFRQKNLLYLGVKLTQEIFRLNQEILYWLDGNSGASTLTAQLYTPKKNYFAHAGDSRIYKNFPSKGWQAITSDHCNQEGKLIDYMGKPKNLAIDTWESPQRGGEFLLCTDGFYHLQDWHLLGQSLRIAPQEQVKRTLEELAEFVIAKGEQDNCSALYLSIAKAPRNESSP